MKVKHRFLAVLLLSCLLFAACTAEATNLSVGDKVYFGVFEQDNDIGNGPEKLLWRVLAVDTDKQEILLLSEYVLTAGLYDPMPNHDWRYSLVRAWLNGESYDGHDYRGGGLINAAFTPEEQEAILPFTMLMAGNTADKLFLPDSSLVIRYLPDEPDRIAYPTVWAKENPGITGEGRLFVDKQGCCYWMTSTHSGYFNVVSISFDGTLYAFYSYDSHSGIRPALKMDAAAVSIIKNKQGELDISLKH